MREIKLSTIEMTALETVIFHCDELKRQLDSAIDARERVLVELAERLSLGKDTIFKMSPGLQARGVIGVMESEGKNDG